MSAGDLGLPYRQESICQKLQGAGEGYPLWNLGEQKRLAVAGLEWQLLAYSGWLGER